MLYHLTIFMFLFMSFQFIPNESFELIETEQEATTLRPSTLLVQIITEPESLIRLFDGLNIGFEMARHWGRTGSALLRLPFNKEILSSGYDHAGLDVWKRPYYARMPTMFATEAPRYIRMPQRRRDSQPIFDHLNELYHPLWL